MAAARPPTTAAADEPRPRECGMALRQRTTRPGALTAGGLQPTVDGAHHQVLGAQRHLAGALPLDLDDQAGIVVSTTISS